MLSLGVFLAIMLGKAAPTPAALETPKSADAFVDSVGLNVRMSYTEWPTATNWVNPNSSQNIRNLLVDLGVRHLRDRIPEPNLSPNVAYVNPRLATLYRDHGLRFMSGIDTRSNDILAPSQIGAYVNWYASGSISLDGAQIPVRSLLEATEGPNEYDYQSQKDPNWASNLRSYQSQLYSQVKAKSTLAQLPILMPSLIKTNYCASPVGSLESSITFGNIHSYPNYPYMRGPATNVAWHLSNVASCSGTKKVWATETGYFTKTGITSAINETTAAKYTPRLLTEYFKTGKISRTYLFQLVEGGVDGWGLIAAQPTSTTVNGWKQYSLRPKPSYRAVKSLLQLLKEASWSKTDRRWVAPAVTLKPINLSFQGMDSSTHYLLLQKSNGRYYLLLWQEVESFNPTKGNFSVPADNLTVVLPPGSRPLNLYKYNSQFTYSPYSLQGSSSTLTLDVPDSVAVLEFIPPAQ
ncbi:MAG TPA: hypothetical protein V6D07_15475 [Trichocoleus sp.]